MVLITDIKNKCDQLKQLKLFLNANSKLAQSWDIISGIYF